MKGGYCADCGHSVAEGAQFCGKCGAPASMIPEADRRCAACGTAPADPGDRFCSVCGQPLPGMPLQCPSCSSPAIENWRFCAACGASLARSDPQTSTSPVSRPLTPVRPTTRRPAWIVTGAVLVLIGLVGLGIGIARQMSGMGLAGGYVRSPATPADDRSDIAALVEQERKKEDQALAAKVAELEGTK